MQLLPKTYLVAPLDWGLGHATRCIPLIRLLIGNGHHVILAASGNAKLCLEEEFPQLLMIDFPGVHVSFETNQGFGWKTMLLGWHFWRVIKREISETALLVKEHNVDVVISDNRYGVRNRDVPSILITHQLFVKVPRFFEYVLHRLMRKVVKEFDQCWVPDVLEKNNLSGELSHGQHLPQNVYYIGGLSRLQAAESNVVQDIACLVLISGPEPARGDFEREIVALFQPSKERVVVVCGRSKAYEDSGRMDDSELRIVPMASSQMISDLVSRSKRIVCRAGYSSIMDLVAMKRSAILVATPGQSEQEYLAQYLCDSRHFRKVDQQLLRHQLVELLDMPECAAMGFMMNAEREIIRLLELIPHK